jgi:hypothetical protein
VSDGCSPIDAVVESTGIELLPFCAPDGTPLEEEQATRVVPDTERTVRAAMITLRVFILSTVP